MYCSLLGEELQDSVCDDEGPTKPLLYMDMLTVHCMVSTVCTMIVVLVRGTGYPVGYVCSREQYDLSHTVDYLGGR